MKCENEEASIYQDRLQTGIGKTPQKCRFLARCYKEDRHRKKFVLLEKKCVFCRWHTRGCPPMTRSCCADATRTTPGCGKRLLRCHFSRTIEYLPRQPRDTHRENLKTTTVSAGTLCCERSVCAEERKKKTPRVLRSDAVFLCMGDNHLLPRQARDEQQRNSENQGAYVCLCGCRLSSHFAVVGILERMDETLSLLGECCDDNHSASS